MNNNYDFIIIGGGAAGLVAAKLAVGMGKKTVIIEKKKIGGDCTLTGCVPSKTLIHSAKISRLAGHAKQYGFSDNVELKSNRVMNHVRDIIDKVYNTHTPEKLQKEGIDTIIGDPTFTDPFTLQVKDLVFNAKKFLIATGSSPFIPNIEGLDDYLTNESLFELEKLPKSIVIMGGGPIGMEMASALNALGVSVTVVEMRAHILSKEDTKLSLMLKKMLIEDGVKIYNNTKITQVRGSKFICDGEVDSLEAEKLLVAVGRKPNLKGLGLENIGIKYDEKKIIVNQYLQTNKKNIYACGDVVGPYLFSHVAEHQAMRATQNAFLPFKKKFDYENLSWVTFTLPELASMGMNEKDARDKGYKVKVYEHNYDQVDRAICDSSKGMGRFVCDNKGNLLGAQILGERAGEVIHEVILAKKYGIKFSKLHWVVHPYPTYNEIIKKASRKCYIDLLRSNFFIKLISKIFGGKHEKK